MKKLLFIIFFLFCFLNNTHTVRAKDFQKETPSTKIEASVIGGKIDISIRNKLTSSGGYQKGTLSIYTKKNGNTYLDQIFSKEFTINNGSIEKTSFSGLDSSKKTDYYLVWSGTELPFSTFWYGLSFGNKKGDGGYDITFFGDPKDQRKMFLLLSKSSITNLIGDIFNSTQNNTFIELGKLSSSSTIGTGQKSVSLPVEKHGRYYAYLLAQDVNGEYYPISSHRETVVFGTLVGEIFYKKLGKSDFEKTGTNQYKLTGIIDASKHKPTDIVPLSSIKVSGAFYDKNTGQRILGIGPVEPKEDGRYEIEILTNGVLQDNTDYDLILNFSSSTGAEATYKVKGVNTTKGYIIPETGKEAEDFLNKNSYRLLAPIPGMTMLLDPELCKLEQEKNPGEICDINAFLNFILQLAIGAAAVVLVIRIIITGYGYILTDVPYIKVKFKGQFTEAMIGLVIALSSYLILNTVSPKLVSNDIKIEGAEFEIEKYPTLDSQTYQTITGKPVLPKNEYVILAQKISQEYKIDSCLLIATATAESNMNPGVFGSDADFAESSKISSPSRRAFINSGEKYSGAKFEKGSSSLRTDKKFKNDAPKGVVDGRFSFGFGMLGITMFPEGYGTKEWEAGPSSSLKNKPLVMDNSWPLNPKTGKKYTYMELLDAETSLRLGATLLQKKVAECKDPYVAMYAFNKGGCPKSSNGAEVRRSVYNQCKGIK